MGALASCLGFVVGLALIGVGVGIIRPARPSSGYLFIAAGVFELLTRCCTGVLSPENLMETGQVDPELIGPMIMVTQIGGTFEAIVVAILLAVALAGLARDLKATAPAPE